MFGGPSRGYDDTMTESNTHSNDETTSGTNTAADQTTDSGEQLLGAGAPDDGSNTEKDPDAWVTGGEPMTGAQKSYLDTLAREAGETLSPDLTKAEASEHIDRLQSKTGRGA